MSSWTWVWAGYALPEEQEPASIIDTVAKFQPFDSGRHVPHASPLLYVRPHDLQPAPAVVRGPPPYYYLEMLPALCLCTPRRSSSCLFSCPQSMSFECSGSPGLPPKLARTTALVAVNSSIICSSSSENHLGTMNIRSGIRRMISTGKLMAARVCETATHDATPAICRAMKRKTLRRRTVSNLSPGWMKRCSDWRCLNLASMPLDSMEPHLSEEARKRLARQKARGQASAGEGGDLTPTTKKTPANKAVGMVWSTTRRGPVMVPMRARPMRKWEMRCSTTAFARVKGSRISFSPSAVRMVFTSVS
jgi:hypothetical protein